MRTHVLAGCHFYVISNSHLTVIYFREQVDALEKENVMLMEKIKALEETVRRMKNGGSSEGFFSPRHHINDLIEEEEEDMSEIGVNDVNPEINHDNEVGIGMGVVRKLTPLFLSNFYV